ncbi:hypothetical protein [Phaffia rhodozyma]|uniref:DUF202 domain-containing protein n=1 Tax=Phaffia rhodozyma TaxID=264483 RepID=A0A0F7SRM4_PHARH|nr:hypothetical protein [Phaffia rhodozyma]
MRPDDSGVIYRGHRRESFMPLDQAEQVELRARQRTFEGAWTRTALVNLGYGAVVLKVFDRRFLSIGLLYTTLSIVLIIVAVHRGRQSNKSFSDKFPHRYDGETLDASQVLVPTEEPSPITHQIPSVITDAIPVLSPEPFSDPDTSRTPTPVGTPPGMSSQTLTRPLLSGRQSRGGFFKDADSSDAAQNAQQTRQKLDQQKRVFGAPFVTAGGAVLLFSSLVCGMEIALFVLIMKF